MALNNAEAFLGQDLDSAWSGPGTHSIPKSLNRKSSFYVMFWRYHRKYHLLGVMREEIDAWGKVGDSARRGTIGVMKPVPSSSLSSPAWLWLAHPRLGIQQALFE
jgi:hypothetical protein